MQVYVELALAENFCMDFTLLYCAKRACKNACSARRVSAASALGACFAVLFPLIPVGGAIAIIIKIAAGVLLCALAGKYTKLSGFVKFACAFFAFSFLLGGALIAIFSLAGVSYVEGGGFVISSVPVGIPLFFALVMFIAARKLFSKMISRNAKNAVKCSICVGEQRISADGFYDSGNRVYYEGEPVNIIPSALAEKLIDVGRIKSHAVIHTVAGKGKISVFTADEMQIDDGKSKRTLKRVRLGVSAHRIDKIILHPDIAEVN